MEPAATASTEPKTQAPLARNNSARGQARPEPPSAELAEAQKARAQLESRLKTARQELDAVTTTSVDEKKRIKELAVENLTYLTKLRDRDEELREKSKLLDVNYLWRLRFDG